MIDLNSISVQEVVAYLAGAAGLGGIIKGFLSDSKASKAEARAGDIETARLKTKAERDQEFQGLKTRVAVLESQNKEMKERLTEGTSQFKALDDKVDTTNNRLNTTNDLLNQIVGALKNSGLKFNEGKL